jgi:hypothetical protein
MDDRAGPRVGRSIETMELRIGGIHFGIQASPPLAARLSFKYGDFFRPDGPARSPAPRVRIEARLADYSDGPAALPSVRLEEGKGGRLLIRGDCCASLDLQAGWGCVSRGDGIAAVDTLVRLSLSLLAPAEGWVLLHGAAIELTTGGWALLLGRSGAGKSTAARAFVSYCDEHVLARWDRGAAEASSTPYWNGTPGSALCEAIVCLERSETPGSQLLRGSEAVRALLPHLVRHVERDAVDRMLFGRLLDLVREVPVLRARLRSGPSYVAHLDAELKRQGFAPRWKTPPGAKQPATSEPRPRQGGSPWL